MRRDPSSVAQADAYFSFYWNTHSFLQLCILTLVVIMFCLYSSQLIPVRFVSFNTNLNKLEKNNVSDLHDFVSWMLLVSLGLLFVTECSLDAIIIGAFLICPELMATLLKISKPCNKLKSLLYLSLGIYILDNAVSSSSHYLSLFITLIICTFLTRKIPNWVFVLLLLLANDIELNPGPSYHENFFTFMNWNLISLVKNNFERMKLIEAHNSIFNYDLISLCETVLNSRINIPDL